MIAPGDDSFLRRRDSRVSEDSFEDCDASADDDVVGNVLHDGGSLTGDKSHKNGSLVQVPEEEEFAPRIMFDEFYNTNIYLLIICKWSNKYDKLNMIILPLEWSFMFMS